jgi:hypothetical protein
MSTPSAPPDVATKQGVSCGDDVVPQWIQSVHQFGRLWDGAVRLGVADINVLRAIAETLAHRNEKTAFRIGDHAVCPIAPTRGKVNTQQSDRRSGFQPRGRRIISVWQGGDAEGLRIWT